MSSTTDPPLAGDLEPPSGRTTRMRQNRNLILTVVAFGLLATALGLLASWPYALVALLVGALCVGGVSVASFVAQKADAPFSPEDSETPAGDTTQHSDVSSAAGRNSRGAPAQV